MASKFIHDPDFSNAFRYAAIGMALVGLDGSFMKVNPSLCRLLEYKEDELIRLRFQDITHPDDLEIDLDYARQLFAGEIDSYNMEKRYFTKSGKTVWILLTGSMVSENGVPKHFIAQIQNISEQKSTQQKLEFSENRFRGIFNSAFQFIGFLDTDGVLIEANQTAIEFAGLTPEDVIGKKFWDCFWWQISPETQMQLKLAFERAIKGETVVYEVAVWDKNKHPHTILFNLKPLLDADGNVVAVIP